VAGIRGLFVRKSGVYGTTPVAARKDIAGLVAATAAFGARPGVLSGCVVSGTTSGWTYSVSAGHLVTVRSAADGAMPWCNDAASTVATSAAPASGSRIDLITAYHNDVDNGDADSNPVLGVVQGAAGSPGVAPGLPTGAIELGRCTLPSGASNTQGGTFSAASVQYTTARGAPIPVTGVTQRDALTASASVASPIVVTRRDTGAQERSSGSTWDTGGQPVNYTPVLSAATTPPTVSSALGRYSQIGKTYWGQAEFVLSSACSGTLVITLPVATANPGGTVLGAAYMVDASASSLRFVGVVLQAGGDTATLSSDNATGAVSGGVPFTWATGDSLRVCFAGFVA